MTGDEGDKSTYNNRNIKAREERIECNQRDQLAFCKPEEEHWRVQLEREKVLRGEVEARAQPLSEAELTDKADSIFFDKGVMNAKEEARFIMEEAQREADRLVAQAEGAAEQRWEAALALGGRVGSVKIEEEVNIEAAENFTFSELRSGILAAGAAFQTALLGVEEEEEEGEEEDAWF
jgi:hypothetical protein